MPVVTTPEKECTRPDIAARRLRDRPYPDTRPRQTEPPKLDDKSILRGPWRADLQHLCHSRRSFEQVLEVV
jgi:hypothetical protein